MRDGIHEARRSSIVRSKSTPTTLRLWLEAPDLCFDDFFFGWGDPSDRLRSQSARASQSGYRPRRPIIASLRGKGRLSVCRAASTKPLAPTDAGLAANPNDVLLLEPRATAENSLGRSSGQGRCRAGDALSPRDTDFGIWHSSWGRGDQSPPFRRRDRRISQGDRPGL